MAAYSTVHTSCQTLMCGARCLQTSDCPNDFCLYGSILNYTKQATTEGSEQYYALKFLIHFMGDIHQPLHCGFKSDAGGNDEKGSFLGNDMTLHEVCVRRALSRQNVTGLTAPLFVRGVAGVGQRHHPAALDRLQW